MMKMVRTGIASREEIKRRTIQIASGKLKRQPDEPRIWFPSLDAAFRAFSAPIASERGSSPLFCRAFLRKTGVHFSGKRSKLLSGKNMRLLEMIQNSRPVFVEGLAGMSRRRQSNLSRTLNKLEQFGLAEFEEAGGRKAPRVSYDKVAFERPLASHQPGAA